MVALLSLRPLESIVHDKPQRAVKKKDVVAGALPQEMSGTVKMLFKEVAVIKQLQQVGHLHLIVCSRKLETTK